MKPKDLVGIPWRVAFALQADGWYLRSDIIWSKPNPMPESVTDRPTKAHEYLFLLSKSSRYFYDADAIREPAEDRPQPLATAKTKTPNATAWLNNAYAPGASGYGHNPSGRNKRSVWEIATESYPEAHFATFPQALVEPCIKSGTSEHGVCPECGAPWEQITQTSYEPTTRTPAPNKGHLGAFGERAANMTRDGFVPNRDKQITHLGWKPSCGH